MSETLLSIARNQIETSEGPSELTTQSNGLLHGFITPDR
jgi:hypothetical protein